MNRVPKIELIKFLESEKIPKLEIFEDLINGRPALFKKSLEEASKVNGLYLEFGVMSGGTTNTIAKNIPDKILYGFDSWKGIQDDFSEIHKKGTWIEKPRIAEPNIVIVEGFYQDTLENFLNEHPEKIAFIHGSSSIYSSTYYYLDTLAKRGRLQVGTIFQIDTVFYTEGEYWYQDEFKALNEIKQKYGLETEYVGWVGYCHCSYRIIKI